MEIGAHESFLCNICSSVVHRCFFTMLIKSESNESKSYVLSIIKRANRTAAGKLKSGGYTTPVIVE